MRSFFTAVLIAVSVLAGLGCESVATIGETPFADLPFRHKEFDFTQGWRITSGPPGVAVEGVLKNTRYVRMEELSVGVSLLKGGKVVTKKMYYVPQSVENGQTCRFAVVLKGATVAPGDRIRFDVSYLGLEGSNGTDWTSSFTVDAVNGRTIVPRRERSSED